MSTGKNALFTGVGIALGALVTALCFLAAQRCNTSPEASQPAEPSDTAAVERAPEPEIAQTRNFDTPKWEILSPARDLQGNCDICGQIFDDAGTPLEGAAVRLRLMDEPWETANLPDVAITDEKGQYCFRQLTNDAIWQLFAWAEDYAVASYEDVTCGAATDLSLSKGAALTLRFVDVEGYSVPYVEVHIAGSSLWPMRSALADERGRLTIKGLTEGVYSFNAQRDDLSFSVLDPITLEPGEEVELEAQMTRVPAIQVTVKNGQNGKPVSNAVVTAVPQNESLLAHTYLTDAQGTAQIVRGSVAGMLLTVYASGYVQKQVASILPGATIDILLSEGSVIQGTVETPGGKPIEGATITVLIEQGGVQVPLPNGNDRSFLLTKAAAELGGIPKALDVDDKASCIPGPARIPLPETDLDTPLLDAAHKQTAWQKTDASGAFTLNAVPMGQIQLSAAHDSYVQHRKPTLNVQPGAPLVGIPVLMKPGARLSLRVISAAGQPISPASITVYDMDGQILKTAETESNGYSELAGLPEAFRIEASAPMYIPGARKIFGPPGKEIDATLRLADANETLRGRVVNKLGTGMEGITIEAELLDKGLVQVLTTVSESDGTFMMEGAGSGTYSVRARFDSTILATASDVKANSQINLVLEKELPSEESGVTSIASIPLAPALSNPMVPPPSAERFGSGDSLGVTTGRGSARVSPPRFSPAPLPPVASSSGTGIPPLQEPSPNTQGQDTPAADSYTEGSSYGSYGAVDDLVVTGPPAGIGTIPIELKQKNKKVVVANVQPGSLVSAAGLKPGAIVLAIDGKNIAGVAMARRALQGTIGSVVMIDVEQDDEPLSVVVQRERK